MAFLRLSLFPLRVRNGREEEKGREGKRREEKRREGKGREGKGREVSEYCQAAKPATMKPAFAKGVGGSGEDLRSYYSKGS